MYVCAGVRLQLKRLLRVDSVCVNLTHNCTGCTVYIHIYAHAICVCVCVCVCVRVCVCVCCFVLFFIVIEASSRFLWLLSEFGRQS